MIVQSIFAASTTTALGGLSIMAAWAPVARKIARKRR
jgi:hypothetical protein